MMFENFRKQIGINDIWLSVFMIILLVHIAVGMFLPADSGKEPIDVVTRTATAVLAGYFVSKNFVTQQQSPIEDEAQRARHNFQTNIVAATGLFALGILLTARYVRISAMSMTAISQLRDIFIASVAFLMGTSKGQ